MIGSWDGLSQLAVAAPPGHTQFVAPHRGQLFQCGSPIAPQPPQRTDLTVAISGRSTAPPSFQTTTAPAARTTPVSHQSAIDAHKSATTREIQMARRCFRLRGPKVIFDHSDTGILACVDFLFAPQTNTGKNACATRSPLAGQKEN